MVINAAYGRVGCKNAPYGMVGCTEEDLELFNEMGLTGIKPDCFVFIIDCFCACEWGFLVEEDSFSNLECEKRQA